MISARQIIFERNFQPLFQPVSLAVEAGELLLITGANGSGKTTLLRILAGLLTAHEGAVERSAPACSYLGHRLAVKDDLSVRENLQFYAGFEGGTGEPGTAITRLGLEACAEQAARTLSAGQRKRCALARLPLAGAALWLLDEPYSNLDNEGIDRLNEMLRQHLESGGACVMSTHGGLRPHDIEYRELVLEPITG